MHGKVERYRKSGRSGRLIKTELCYHILTKHFTVFRPHNQEIGEVCVVQNRHTADFEAQTLWNVWSVYLNRLPYTDFLLSVRFLTKLKWAAKNYNPVAIKNIQSDTFPGFASKHKKLRLIHCKIRQRLETTNRKQCIIIQKIPIPSKL